MRDADPLRQFQPCPFDTIQGTAMKNEITRWPYPGSYVYCLAASTNGTPVRKYLHSAAQHNDGGIACEKCNVRTNCNRLHATMNSKKH